MNKKDLSRDKYMLEGKFAKQGYDWWWHSFTGINKKTKKHTPFFIEFFVINPSLSPEKIILGQSDENKKNGNRPCYVMVKTGMWGENAKQLHRFFPISDMELNNDDFSLVVGDCEVSETATKGSISLTEDEIKEHPEYMCNAGTISWDLKINKQIAYNVGYGASKFFRKIKAFEMFWHAEGVKTDYTGTLIFDGEEYDIVSGKNYGYADKNWGCDFTSPWVWIGSSNLKSKITGKKLNNSCIDIGGGKPKVFGIPLDRKLLMELYYEGKSYEFNFSKLWTHCKTKFNCYETEKQIVWEISTENTKNIMEIKCYCNKKDMLLINYEAPTGLKLHNRLWNGGNGYGEIYIYDKAKNKERVLIDNIEMKNVGCEYGEYDK